MWNPRPISEISLPSHISHTNLMGRTRALLTHTTDRGGVQIELLELGPESLRLEAIEAWR